MGQIKYKTSPKFPTIQYRSWHDSYNTVSYVCVCNSVSGTALAISSQSKGELNSYCFCWQCTHTDQPTDVRLFVCMLILTVHVIIIFTHSAMNAVEVGFSFLWASSTLDRKWNSINFQCPLEVGLSCVCVCACVFERKEEGYKWHLSAVHNWRL